MCKRDGCMSSSVLVLGIGRIIRGATGSFSVCQAKHTLSNL